MMKDKRNRLVIIGLIIILLVLVGVIIATTISRIGKVGVTIHKVPDSAKLIVDGSVMNGSTIYLEPGSYVVVVEQDGFTKTSFTQNVASNQPDQSIIVALQPASDEAKKWASDNQKKYLDIEGLYGSKIAAEGEANYRNYPILKSLPYSSASGPFTIDYWFDDNNKPYLIVSNSTAPGRREAMKWIITHNDNSLSNLTIRFEDNKSLAGGYKE